MGKRKRITRKDLKHDALLESASKTTKFVQHHTNKVLIGLAAVVVIILLGTMVVRARRATALLANAALADATQTLNAGLLPQASDQLQAVIVDYPGTRGAGAATCYLATVYYHQQRYDEALQLFDDYLHTHGRAATLRRVALEGRAAVLEQQRAFTDAAQAYRRLAAASRDVPSAFSRYLMSAVRCYRSQPDWQAARDAAADILKLHPNSHLAADARMAIAEADQHLSR